MEQVKLIKNLAVIQTLRLLPKGHLAKFPAEVSYNTVSSAIRRLRKEGINLVMAREGKYYIIRHDNAEQDS